MRNKKSSLSLSINAIVVLILAITMLTMALGIIKGLGGKVTKQLEGIVSTETDPIPATFSNPLTLSRGETLILSPGETVTLKFSAFNTKGVISTKANNMIDSTPAISTCFVVTTILSLVQQTLPSADVPINSNTDALLQVKASTTPIDTICKICTSVSMGGGCSDFHVIIK